MYYILTINPGSTSTKTAVFCEEQELFSENIEHSASELEQFPTLVDQLDFRIKHVLDVLKNNDFSPEQLSCVVGRGGMLPPLKTGGYIVNESMKDRLVNHPKMQHASNLGALMADAIAAPLKIPAYIYDAVVADELPPEAHVTGFPEIKRQSFCHVLNSRAMVRRAAQMSGRKFDACNYVVAHMGGGISISAHHNGKMIDSISDDAGPFSPDRSGSINLMYMVDLCYSGKYTRSEMMKKIRGGGGMKAHLGTHDMRQVVERINQGDDHARLILDAMALQVAKGVGSMLCVFEEPVDGVVLTGGLAWCGPFVEKIVKKLRPVCPVIILPGENEMESLALGGLRILQGKEAAHIFE